VDWDGILREGDSFYATQQQLRIDNATAAANVIAVAFVSKTMLACGGANGNLSIYNIPAEAEAEAVRVNSFSLPGPVISLHAHPDRKLVAAGLMDGSLAVISADSQDDIELSKQHSKYVICVRWGGLDLLASASSDKSVVLYRCLLEEGPLKLQLQVITTLRFVNTPESLAFVPGTDPSSLELVVALRETNHLVYVNCSSLEQRNVSLNANEWDQHTSFTALALSPSPNGSLLLVATDKDTILCLSTGSNQRVRLFAGHSSGAYARPALAWCPSGKYVYCNSENDNEVYVYCVASERIVGKLAGHRGVIRDIAVSAVRRVATASHDKAVIVWRNPAL